MESDLEPIYLRFAYVYSHLKDKARKNPSSILRQEDDFLVAADNLFVLEFYKSFPDKEKEMYETQ